MTAVMHSHEQQRTDKDGNIQEGFQQEGYYLPQAHHASAFVTKLLVSAGSVVDPKTFSSSSSHFPVFKVGGNAWERRSQACHLAFPECFFLWECTFPGRKDSFIHENLRSWAAVN